MVRPYRVALFATGDELVEPGQVLKPGQIYNSNQIMLHSLLEQLGCDVVISHPLPDNPDEIQKSLYEAAQKCDLIVTNGGVSVGEEDHMKAVLEALGQLSLWRIAVKPGKPMAFGHINQCAYLGLPGNPVSSFVTFLRFAAPFIRRCQGETDVLPKPMPVVSINHFDGGSREEYLRAQLTDKGAELYPQQGSHILKSVSASSGLVRRPAHTDIKAGSTVEYFPYTSFLRH